MDSRLKQRLVGAAVVVALAVIIVPELIKKPADDGKPVVAPEVSSRPQLTSEGITTTLSLPSPSPEPPPVPEAPSATPPPLEPPPVTEAPAAAQLSPEPPPPVAEPADDEPETMTTVRIDPEPRVETIDITKPPKTPVDLTEPVKVPGPKPEPKATPKPEPKPEPKPVQAPKPKTPKPVEPVALPKIELIGRANTASPVPSASPRKAASGGDWIVQAGSFSLMRNATLLQDKLRSRGFDVSIERATVQGRTLYRVRVGPQASLSESRSVRERLQRETGIKGQVVASGE